MNQLIFIEPKRKSKMFLSLQKCGRVGFSKDANKKLNLNENRFVKFGVDDSENVFLKVQKEHDEECFRIIKSGEYFFLHSFQISEILKVIKYERTRFDLVEDKDGFYKLEKIYK